jgi:hypothetical protein
MKNPDLSVLRVAVVPTETGNGITQDSTYEEIVACKETEYYSVPDYFKAQNDEQLGLHWSFLLDTEKKVDITGSNTDGIDMDTKAIHIDYIKKVIKEWGSTSCVELELDHSPCLNSIGNGKNNVCELVEQFYADSVETVVYQDELTLSYNNYDYEDLSDDIINEIYRIMQDYEADQLRTEKRCKN